MNNLFVEVLNNNQPNFGLFWIIFEKHMSLIMHFFIFENHTNIILDIDTSTKL